MSTEKPATNRVPCGSAKGDPPPAPAAPLTAGVAEPAIGDVHPSAPAAPAAPGNRLAPENGGAAAKSEPSSAPTTSPATGVAEPVSAGGRRGSPGAPGYPVTPGSGGVSVVREPTAAVTKPQPPGVAEPVSGDGRPASPDAPSAPGYPLAPESGGAAARLYHAEHGCSLPFIDLSAPRPEAKSYPEAEAIPLPYPPRARTGFRADVPEGLGDLLALAYGVTRIEWGGAGVRAGRPLPSGGAAYPGELYLAAEFGLCHYLPSAHALERLRNTDVRRQVVDALEAHPAERPTVILLLTSRHEANLPAFGGFGHKLQTLDTGVMAGQTLALIDAAGAEARVHTRFDEARLGSILGLDPRAESVRAVITAGIGSDEPIPVPAFSTDPGADRAGLPRRIMSRHTAADGFEPVSVPLPRVLEVFEAAAEEIPSDIRAGHGAEFASVDLYCVAHRVDGLDPACYRRSAVTGALTRVRETVDPRMLFPSGGDGELAHFQAACALLVVGDYEHGYRVHGDRWYRMLNLHAGIIAQRIGLAATGLGLGSMLRCDYQVKVADRLIHASPGRTALVAVLIGLEHGVGSPGHRLLLGGYGS